MFPLLSSTLLPAWKHVETSM